MNPPFPALLRLIDGLRKKNKPKRLQAPENYQVNKGSSCYPSQPSNDETLCCYCSFFPCRVLSNSFPE